MTMMMTSTHFNAWLLSIELGTGVVIGQHFRARCAETFANNSESCSASEGRKEERERKRESAHGCLRDVRFDSLFFPFVFFGSLCTEFCWTIDTRRVVFRRFYLRLPTANVRGRYYGWLGSPWFRIHTTIFLTFFPRVLVRDDGKEKKKMMMAEEARLITH